MKIGKFLYRYRSLTPVPIIIILLFFSQPTLLSVIYGFILTFFGEIIRLISIGYTGLTTRSKNVQSKILVTNGPYSYVRNPIYVGNFFISLGVVISANSLFPWYIIAYILLFALQYSFIIKFEEQFLSKAFGKEHRNYMENVPSFSINFRGYKNKSKVKPNFRKAFKSEKTTLIIITLLFSIFLTFLLTKFSPLHILHHLNSWQFGTIGNE